MDLERGLWIFPEHKTKKKTGRPRVVYLTPAMVALTTRLVEEHPTGPLFRGPRNGSPFTRNGIRCRFRRLRKKLPHLKGVISYTFRHSFATDALEKGVGVVQGFGKWARRSITGTPSRAASAAGPHVAPHDSCACITSGGV